MKNTKTTKGEAHKMKGKFLTFEEYTESVIKLWDKLEAAGGNWNDFFCGQGGCPYITEKCDPDYCGYYYHYKKSHFWKYDNGKLIFFDENG
jgi:hypothetical protein